MSKRKETAAERDERIVAENAPYEIDAVGSIRSKRHRRVPSYSVFEAAMLLSQTIVRYLNATPKRVARAKAQGSER